MESTLFVRGLLLGMAVAAVVGPMALLCIQRTLTQGQPAGLATGAGIAAADGCYAVLAAFGITAISQVLLDHHIPIEFVGGIALLILGVRIARTIPPLQHANPAVTIASARWFTSAFALTLANPMTIISFGVIFAGLGLARSDNISSGALLVTGVVLGSMCWWLALTTVVRAFGRIVSRAALIWINRLAGSLIAVFGVLAVVSAVG